MRLDTNILLETGTNELEVLEFTVGTQHYGINVAKVKEILPYQQGTAVPNAHPCVEGIVMIREEIFTMIDLFKSLHIEESTSAKDMLIVTNFNNLKLGFHVSGVEGIHRVSWEAISKPDQTIIIPEKSYVTGIVKLQEKILILLDFESIITEVTRDEEIYAEEIKSLEKLGRGDFHLLVVEDSPLLLHLLKECLYSAGYTNLSICSNGKEAFDFLTSIEMKENTVDLVISDIEMPQMDGLHLTKKIKEDPNLVQIPVIIFSSLVNDQLRSKCERVGADAMITKPQIKKLVSLIDSYIIK